MNDNKELLKWYEENVPNNCPNSVDEVIKLITSTLRFIPENNKHSIYKNIYENSKIPDDLCNPFTYKFYIKNICNSIGIWGPCWKDFCKQLSLYFNNKKVLEVGCGNGLLSLGLEYYNTNIIPTSSKNRGYNTDVKLNNKIEYIDAKDAINKYKSDINYILISWPPYEDPLLEYVFDLSIKYNKKLIYIGESEYGCTGSESFWSRIEKEGYYLNKIDGIYFDSFYRIYDDIYTFNNK